MDLSLKFQVIWQSNFDILKKKKKEDLKKKDHKSIMALVTFLSFCLKCFLRLVDFIITSECDVTNRLTSACLVTAHYKFEKAKF